MEPRGGVHQRPAPRCATLPHSREPGMASGGLEVASGRSTKEVQLAFDTKWTWWAKRFSATLTCNVMLISLLPAAT